MPVFNGEEFIAEAINSALAQTWQNRELIVVDDGSTDRTAQILDGYGDRIKRLRMPERSGHAAARNYGARAAAGEWIAALDADDVWEPAKLETQLSISRDADIVYTNALNIGECRHIDTYSLHNRTLPTGDIFPELARINFITHSSIMVRRTVLEKVNGYRDEVRTSCDWDLYLRIAAQGGRFVGTMFPLTQYRWRSNSVSKNHNQASQNRLDVVLTALNTDAGQRLTAAQRRQALGEVWFVSASFAAVTNHWQGIRWYGRSLIYEPLRLQTWKEIVRCVLHACGISRERFRKFVMNRAPVPVIKSVSGTP